jgi:antitoxin component YwqK of YwqJK toxin-antitoxin module
MKIKILLAVLIVFASLACQGLAENPSGLKHVSKTDEQGTYYEYTAYTGLFGREVIHGKYEAWYKKNGLKYIEAEYSKGKLNGVFILYWRDGKGKYEGVWKDGKPWDGVVQVGHELKRYSTGKFMGTVED